MSNQKPGLSAWFLAIGLSTVMVASGLFWAESKRETILDHESREDMSGLTAAGVLPVYKCAVLPAVAAPSSPTWDDAPTFGIALFPQKITMPQLDTATVDSVWVQALTDGRDVAWRVRWPDSSADMNVDMDRFCDAVALQFPLSADAPFTMGGKDQLVQVLHWKGIWQKDIDEHFQDVIDLHPNYWTDLYWFATGSFPYPIPEAFADTVSHQWFVAYKAGNPLSDIYRTEPVEELTAAGYGTLTSQPNTVTRGRGEWKDGWWSVVFHRPLRTADPLDFQFDRGSRGTVGIAVWEGSAKNVGGRKNYSNWISFEVQS